jgi:hypothetical protein
LMATDNTFKINEQEYLVHAPDAAKNRLAQLEYSRVYGESLRAGAPLRTELYDYMIKRNIWSQEKQQELQDLANTITENEKKLLGGDMKLSVAKELALQLKKDRVRIQILITERSTSDSSTAEGQAENARFQRLLSLCLVYKGGDNDGKPVFKNVDELMNAPEGDLAEAAQQGFNRLSDMVYKVDEKYEHKLPENEFLKEWGWMDDKFRLMNDKGQLVDALGRRVNEDGHLVDEDGELIDYKGTPVDKEGNYKIEKKPFLDDEGLPVTPKNKEPVKE